MKPSRKPATGRLDRRTATTSRQHGQEAGTYGRRARPVGGGDPLYLCYWMRQSGLADLFPLLRETVYVGVSAGSLVMAPKVGDEFVYGNPLTGGDRALGLVDFSMFPHLDHAAMPEHSMANAERWAAALQAPGYAIDDDTAIRVADGAVDVISEGRWKLFAP